MSVDLAACDECGRTDRTVRDLGLRAPLALCDACFRTLLEVRVNRQPLPLSRVLDDVRRSTSGHG
ncbi:hypothetical protein [Streptomyces sp. SPB162]|uniref:hypothetical protein n=1 Tax=Streptomyces sp. SPB162 TaxID=2940560 RepID=UPI002405A71E|nr:hypothetical protein [Streptomyces sp. SPB162]MDF9811269.1 hypothetical protein [Streptomyces sp. SPB162]